MIRLIHIINPYITPENSEDYLVQSKTISSIERARDYARGVVAVEVLAKVDPEEREHYQHSLGPKGFVVEELSRDARDLEQDFQVERKFPLLPDLVDLTHCSLLENGDPSPETYVIITNMDICVMPYFYAEVAQMIASGRECFVINRRTVDKDLMYRELEEAYIPSGDQHIGHDCFIVPLDTLRQFRLEDHILGIGFVFRPFLLNCILRSRNFHEYDDVYLTFHYGDDMVWKSDKFSDYQQHNKEALIRVYRDHLEEVASAPEEKQRWLHKFFSLDFLPAA